MWHKTKIRKISKPLPEIEAGSVLDITVEQAGIVVYKGSSEITLEELVSRERVIKILNDSIIIEKC